jgi:hypothetical protein
LKYFYATISLCAKALAFSSLTVFVKFNEDSAFFVLAQLTYYPIHNDKQVRLFLSEESPSLAGLGSQDHLQAKESFLLHSTGPGSDDNRPPGFEGVHPANHLQIKLSQIPLVKWRCPPQVNHASKNFDFDHFPYILKVNCAHENPLRKLHFRLFALLS